MERTEYQQSDLMQLLMHKTGVSSSAAGVAALVHKLVHIREAAHQWREMTIKRCFEKDFWSFAAFLMSRQAEWTQCSESKETEIWKMD